MSPGCGRVVTRGSATTSTSTTTTTTTLPPGISGTITNYGGDPDELVVAYWFNSSKDSPPPYVTQVTSSEGLLTYNISTPAAGTYYLLAFNYYGRPSVVGDWVGLAGWLGTEEIVASMVDDAIRINGLPITFESAPVRADISLHLIVP